VIIDNRSRIGRFWPAEYCKKVTRPPEEGSTLTTTQHPKTIARSNGDCPRSHSILAVPGLGRAANILSARMEGELQRIPLKGTYKAQDRNRACRILAIIVVQSCRSVISPVIMQLPTSTQGPPALNSLAIDTQRSDWSILASWVLQKKSVADP